MGEVFRARDKKLGREVAIKVLPAALASDAERVTRFRREAQVLAALNHPNIASIYGFEEEGPVVALIMELVVGDDLSARLRKGALPVDEALAIAKQIAEAMEEAHEKGIVHRDLKPANVLINEAGLLKIVDFGVAAAHREGDTQLTKTGYVIGSPKYMAPEQILGRKVDERADVYAIGVILYELFTGVPPYSRGDHMAVMYQHVQGKARPPQEVNPAMPPGLGDIVIKAMMVDKAKRFQSMDELRTVLERFI